MANVRLRDLNPAKFLYDMEVDGDGYFEGSLGIGTGGSVSDNLEVAGGAIRISNLASDKKIHFLRTGGNEFSFEHDTGSFYVYNRTTAKELFTIRNDGNVSVGSGNPTANLHSHSDVSWSGGWRDNLKLSSQYYPCIRLHSTNINKTSLIGNNDDGGLDFAVGGSGDAWGAYAMKIFSNGHITFGSQNNVGGQNHTFNPSASYNQSYCSIALHVPGMAAGKKNWCMRAHPLSGNTSYSYLQFRPLNDDGSDHGDGTFFFNHLFSDIVFKSSSGYNCQLDVESVSGESSVRLRGNTAGVGADWHLWAGGSANDFRIFRSVDGASEVDAPNLALRSTSSSGLGAPGGVLVGTTDTSGGGITWDNRARMLKIAGAAGAGSASGGGWAERRRRRPSPTRLLGAAPASPKRQTTRRKQTTRSRVIFFDVDSVRAA